MQTSNPRNQVYLAAVLLCCLGRAALGAFVLVENGRSNHEIVLVKGATRAARLAASELQVHLQKSTGVQLPIVGDPTDGKGHLFVGPSAHAERLGVTPKGLPPESLRIKTVGKDIILLGVDTTGRPERIIRTRPDLTGTLSAVYAFLERVVGARWYGDDELYTIVPRHETLTVPDLDVTESPAFMYRCLAYSPQGALIGLTGRRWRLGMSVGMNHGHNWYRICPPDKYGKEHPEYFAEINGRRVARHYMKHHGGQVCTTNPDVIRIFAEAAAEYFRVRPGRDMFSVSPNDGGGFCTCKACRALDVEMHTDEKRKGIPVMTDRMLTFYNAVAERFAAIHPKKYLGAYVYSYYKNPPKRVKRVHPNLFLFLAVNSAHGCVTEEQWRQERERISGWTDIHRNMFMYDIFYSRRSGGLIHPIPTHTAQRIRFFHKAGIRGGYLYTAPSWETAGVTDYLMAKLLWNPDVDVERITAEYYRDMYGGAAKAVRAYYDLAEESWRKADRGESRGSGAAEYFASQGGRYERIGKMMLAVEPLVEKGGPMLKAAKADIRDPSAAERFRRLLDHHELAELTITGLQRAARIERADEPADDLLSEFKATIDGREALMQRMKAYAPYLVGKLHASEDSNRSPLRRSAALFLIAQAQGRKEVLSVRRSVAVDGDDTDWEGATFYSFLENMAARKTRGPTQAAIAFDDRAVYFCFRCDEPEKILATPRKRDEGRMFLDDNVEIFLDTNRDGQTYHHLGISAAGAQYDGFTPKDGKPSASWNGDWRAAVKQTERRWVVEVAIPFKTLEVPPPREGAAWRFLLCRTRRGASPGEYQSISPTLGGYHQPDRFADLVFGEARKREDLLKRFDFDTLRPGRELPGGLRLHQPGESSLAEILEGKGRSGTRCFHARIADEKEYVSITPMVSAQPNRSYRLTLSYRAANVGRWRKGTESPITRIIFRDERNKSVTPTQEYSWRSADARRGEDEWATHRHVFRTPAGTAKVSVTVFLFCPGEYWLDDLALEEM